MGILDESAAQPGQLAPGGELNGQIPAEPGGGGGGGGEVQHDPTINSPVVQGHMDELAKMRASMAGKLGEGYDRVLKAGMTMLYSQDTAEAIQQIMTDEKLPMANKLGEGIANLMVMMDNQGNGTMPKELLIPVGTALLFEAADFMFESGMDVTEQDLSDGLEMMVYGIYSGYNIPKETVDASVQAISDKMGFEKETPEEDTAEGGEAAEQANFESGFNAERAKGAM